MQKIGEISVVIPIYNPLRPFPGNTESHMDGWIKNVSMLKIAKEIIIVEMLDNLDKSELFNITIQDPRIRVIHRLNEPPYADPVYSEMLLEAKSDWILFLADDERMSSGMMQFIDSLIEDPAPGYDWAAIQFQREDYIFYNNLWRYIPANGNDPQIRLVNRHRTSWDVRPHTTPVIDGGILLLNDKSICILHYRDYQKIVSWSDRCNEMFKEMPHIVKMQTDYVQRVKQMLGGVS